MKIQYLGQNCFLLTIGEVTIMTDPFYSHGKSESNFDIRNQNVDYILITHAHQDHVYDVEEVLTSHPKTRIIGQPEICAYYNHPESIDLNIGGSFTVEGALITMVSATHTSSFVDGKYGGVASGYIIQADGKTIYLAGDTGVFAEMSLFPVLFGKIDTAILPIGGHYTMDAAQASFASKELLNTDHVIGCHFDTFPPITINHDLAKNIFEETNVNLKLPYLGEIIDL